MTSGAAQSNHARLTAAAGARLGLDVVLVLSGMPGDAATGNIALDVLFGARIAVAASGDGGARAYLHGPASFANVVPMPGTITSDDLDIPASRSEARS